MSSKEQILANVLKNQPEFKSVPDISFLENKSHSRESLLESFKIVATSISTQIMQIKSLTEVRDYLLQKTKPELRLVTSIPELYDIAEDISLLLDADPHDLENVELAILRAEFGVAENGALWLTEKQMGSRVLPFICQNLIILINAADIVPDMHAAYRITADSDHGFASFIAGPSKTADIEQSLVLGAHGPRSLMVFILSIE